jgi:glycosyltransferase involved in cell wall biosynthesis
MKIALYYPWVYLPGGPERTIAELLPRSRHDWTVITNRYERDVTFPALRKARIVELPRVSVDRSMSHVFRAGFRIALQKLPLEGQDALVVFCEGLGDFTLFRNHSIPVACLCFTPLRAVFDEHYASRYLERAGNTSGRRAMLGAASFLFRRIDRFLWRRYQRVFAISKEVRRRIVAGGLRAEADIDLLHPGVDTGRLVPTWRYNREFVIPGRIMWTKNLELAIDAFRLLQSRRPDLGDMRLTIAGWVDRKSEGYAQTLRERAVSSPGIRFVESPSDAELFNLCQSCRCVLYPAFNEDWGLVPLEAMAFGKPVIAVNRGGPEETVVDGVTGYLVEPTPEAFAGAMERLADDADLVRRLGSAGRPRAELFDWSRFAENLDRQVDRLVSAHSPAEERSRGFAGRNAEYGGGP